jgi:hypothetical protein
MSIQGRHEDATEKLEKAQEGFVEIKRLAAPQCFQNLGNAE